MPYYNRAFLESDEAGHRTIERLLRLRQRLSKEVPGRTQEETLLLATWNIRDFDKSSYGYRSEEAMHYIAEVVSRFDLVAIQEVYHDLSGLERLMRLLGRNWKYIVSDVTEGSAGNRERMAFVYDTRKVTFSGVCGELVLPPQKVDGKTIAVDQIARTPYIVGFRSGWTNFLLTSVHIIWGESKAEPDRRVREIEAVAKALKKRSMDKKSWSKNLIVLGDFNIFEPDDATMKALTKHGFRLPEELTTVSYSNAARNRNYDQIMFRVRKDRLTTTGAAGVFDVLDVVYRDDDETTYVPDMGESYLTTTAGAARKNPSSYYKAWRTHQISDHFPMWVEIRINYTEPYLRRLAGT